MPKEKTYSIRVICTNCGHRPSTPNLSTEGAGQLCAVPVEIPKGTNAEKFLMEKKCKNCGCKRYLKRSS